MDDLLEHIEEDVELPDDDEEEEEEELNGILYNFNYNLKFIISIIIIIYNL